MYGDKDTFQNFINGGTALMATWCVLLPVDTIKTNIQKNESGKIRDCVNDIYKNYGIRGFWRGLIPTCVRTIPVAGVSMVGYETVRTYFEN